MANTWSNGLCSCFEDITTCIITYIVPCYTFGKNAEQIGESCILCALTQFIPWVDLWCRVSVRGKIREQRGIEGSCMEDCLMHWLCVLCALVQEARELKVPGGEYMSRE